MQVGCEATQSLDTQVRVAALQCLVKIMSLYYQYMEHYMGPALFAVRFVSLVIECVDYYVWFPRLGPPFGLSSSLVHSLPHLLHLFAFPFFPFVIHFTYFLLLSIRSLSTRSVPIRFQARGHRWRPNLGLVYFVYYCVIYIVLWCDSCLPLL